jgi:hypothetical protein
LSSRSALPIFASFDAFSTMPMALLALIPVVRKALSTWYSDVASSSGLNPTFGDRPRIAFDEGFDLP